MKIIFFLFVLFASHPAFAQKVEQYMNVEIGPFNAADLKLAYELGQKEYHFLTEIKTAGLFHSLYPFVAVYETKGAKIRDSFSARQYGYQTQSRNHIRTKSFVFDQNGILKSRISSKDNERKEVLITLPKEKVDAYDIQTVMAMLAEQLSKNHFCAMEKTVFDGKKQYRVLVQDEGKTTLKDPVTSQKKQALKCSLKLIGGEKQKGDLLWEMTAKKPVYFYILTDPKTKLPFIAKIEIDSTPLGDLKAYTTDINFKG